MRNRALTETGTPTPEGGGLLLVDKPAGITSHDAVAVVRRAAKTRRVGHTGTLDPFATGLLVMLVGRATRLIPYVEGEPKVYEATIRFGSETDTDDNTGSETRTAEPPARGAIDAAVAQLTGTIEQVPPAYSAKQVAGTRAYDAARRGTALELAPSTITVHEWVLAGYAGELLTARITCGAGTYIRALARDLGRLTHSAAHLAALRRTDNGPFSVRDAVTLDQVSDGKFELQPLRLAVPSLPVQQLDHLELGKVAHGNPVAARVAGDRVALVDEQETLVAVAERAADELRPRLVLRDG